MRRRWGWGIVLGLAVLAAAAAPAARAQGGPPTLRIALLSQWTVDRNPGTSLQTALGGGVVDRTVYAWQSGLIQRSSLVPKAIRLVSGPEADALGARGRFHLAEVRPPTGAAAWNEVVLVPDTGRPDDVAVLEVGGEVGTIRQVLATLLVAGPGGALARVPLVPLGLIREPGVPVLKVRFGTPLPASAAPLFHRAPDGLEFLVARSTVEAIVNGGATPNGPADTSPDAGSGSGDWREGDRVFVRVPLAAVRAGAPAVVLAWKDRVVRPDGDGSCPHPSC